MFYCTYEYSLFYYRLKETNADGNLFSTYLVSSRPFEYVDFKRETIRGFDSFRSAFLERALLVCKGDQFEVADVKDPFD